MVMPLIDQMFQGLDAGLEVRHFDHLHKGHRQLREGMRRTQPLLCRHAVGLEDIGTVQDALP
jgi:hypothetical protein